MKRTVVCRIDLGRTRIAGYILYNPSTNEFLETSPKDTRMLVMSGVVNGLCMKNEEISLDCNGFNMHNLKIKSGVGKYRDMVQTGKSSEKTYSVVRIFLTNNGKLYEIVDNKCARVTIEEYVIKGLLQFSDIAGVYQSGNVITPCDGVEIVDLVDLAKDTDITTEMLLCDKLYSVIYSENDLLEQAIDSHSIISSSKTIEKSSENKKK